MYLEIDEGFLDHPKTMRVCGMLGDQNAGMYIIRLWRWACRSAPTGCLDGMTPDEIEMAAGYKAQDGRLYAALASRFIDEKDGKPHALHDWMQHQGGSIKRMNQRADAKRDAARERKKRERNLLDRPKTCHASVTQKQSVTGIAVTPPVQTSPDQTSLLEIPSESPSPRPPERSSETPIAGMEFPCDGVPRSWQLTQEQAAEWQGLFPTLDVIGECRNAMAWVKAKPANQKTAKGMKAFLVGWFGRSKDRGGQTQLRTTGPPRDVRIGSVPAPPAGTVYPKGEQAL